MKFGLRIQIGRTRIDFFPPHLPYRWDVETTLMAPNLYGFGIWIMRDPWRDQ